MWGQLGPLGDTRHSGSCADAQIYAKHGHGLMWTRVGSCAYLRAAEREGFGRIVVELACRND